MCAITSSYWKVVNKILLLNNFLINKDKYTFFQHIVFCHQDLKWKQKEADDVIQLNHHWVQRWPQEEFVQTKYNFIPSSSLADWDWKNTASFWWHLVAKLSDEELRELITYLGQRLSFVLGKVGSWAISLLIWDNSSTSCTT